MRVDQYKQELHNFAVSLPFKAIGLPEFRSPAYVPERVRQPRTYVTLEAGMPPITRFLNERGTVGLLSGEQVMALFREIHWCASVIRRLAQRRFRTPAPARAAVEQARRLISAIEAAEEELFIANRRLVVSCIKPYFWIGQVWLGDFLQEGSKALSNAVRKFDFRRGTPFYAYAQKAVQNRLRNYFRDHVRAGSIGLHPSQDTLAVAEFITEWKRAHRDEEPSDAVIARATGLAEERLLKIRPFLAQWKNTPVPPVSLDALFLDNNANLYDFVQDPGVEVASEAAERTEIWAAVQHLPPRAQLIMRLRFGDGHTLEETGKLLKLTRARIKQIQDDALRKLRQMLRRGVVNPNM